ncbi:MAG: hypothetical protein PHO12_03100 [Bacteroidales bacterium]|nr:hypothetical protein [Bacteroidales bacterium]MDD4685213.1 hypothetical protein [Bacteroidales bacterium]
MKRYLKYILVLLVLPLLLASCQKDKETQEVNKVVENFYIYLNEKNLDKIKEISTSRADRYFEFIFSLGNDLVKIDSINIIQTLIEGNAANVDVETFDIYGNETIYQWYLIKVNEVWKINKLEGYKAEEILTKDDIDHSKRNNHKKDTIGKLK